MTNPNETNIMANLTNDAQNSQININAAGNVSPNCQHVSIQDTADTVPSFDGRNLSMYQFSKS